MKLKLLELAEVLWPLVVIAFGFVLLICIVNTFGMGEIPTIIVGIMAMGMLWLIGEEVGGLIREEIDHCHTATSGTNRAPKGIINKQTEHNSKKSKDNN